MSGRGDLRPAARAPHRPQGPDRGTARWWWTAATILASAAVLRLVSGPAVEQAGLLIVAAAGCVLGAGLATRRHRHRRYRTPTDDHPRPRHETRPRHEHSGTTDGAP